MRDAIRCVKLILKREPVRILFYIIISLPTFFMPVLLLYLERRLIDNAQLEIGIQSIVFIAVLIITAHFILKIFSLQQSLYLEFNLFSRIFIYMGELLHSKIASLSIEHFDDSETYNKIEMGKRSTDFVAFASSTFLLICFLSITLITISTFLFTLHPILIVLIFTNSISIVLKKYLDAKNEYLLSKNNTVYNRKKNYITDLLLNTETALDIKVFGSGFKFLNIYKEALEQTTQNSAKINIKTFGRGILFGFFETICRGLSMIILVYLYYQGNITLGEFVAGLTSFALVHSVFGRMFSYIGDISGYGKNSEPFFTLIDMNDNIGDIEAKEIESIKLKNVSYMYKNSDSNIIKNISVEINKGDKIAIVGENGAGKTTLIKLLTGLIIPQDGKTLFNDIDRRNLIDKSIYKQLSAVFQNYGRYSINLRDNIRISDSKSLRTDEEIIDILKRIGLEDVYKSIGLDGILGRNFGKTDLSKGQWQRLAIGRNMYRDKPVVFLDEPTAAIDPLEEIDIISKLKDQGDKTVIYVTHRLGVVKFVNQILFMKNGEIFEFGSFDELLNIRGGFYEMWEAQKKWYEV